MSQLKIGTPQQSKSTHKRKSSPETRTQCAPKTSRNAQTNSTSLSDRSVYNANSNKCIKDRPAIGNTLNQLQNSSYEYFDIDAWRRHYPKSILAEQTGHLIVRPIPRPRKQKPSLSSPKTDQSKSTYEPEQSKEPLSSMPRSTLDPNNLTWSSKSSVYGPPALTPYGTDRDMSQSSLSHTDTDQLRSTYEPEQSKKPWSNEPLSLLYFNKNTESLKSSFYDSPALTPYGTDRDMSQSQQEQEARHIESAQHLMALPGLSNFGYTCYINAAYRYLSLTLPTELLEQLEAVRYEDPDQNAFHQSLIQLIKQIKDSNSKDETISESLIKALEKGKQYAGNKNPNLFEMNDYDTFLTGDASELVIFILDHLNLNNNPAFGFHTETFISTMISGKQYDHSCSASQSTTYTLNIKETDTRINFSEHIDQEMSKIEELEEYKWTKKALQEVRKETLQRAQHPLENEDFITTQQISELTDQEINELKTYKQEVHEIDDIEKWEGVHLNLMHNKLDSDGRNCKLLEIAQKMLKSSRDELELIIRDKKTQKYYRITCQLDQLIVHTGSSYSGHYVTLSRAKDNNGNIQWIVFNDKEIYKIQSLFEYMEKQENATFYIGYYKAITKQEVL